MSTRVVVTGMGVITPIGIGISDFWEGLIRGQNGIVPITSFDTKDLSTTFAGVVQKYIPKHNWQFGHETSRYVDFVLDAAIEAVDNSGINDISQAAIVLGTSRGGVNSLINDLFLNLNGKEIEAMGLINSFILTGASAITNYFGIRGSVKNVSAACASGTIAIGEAYSLIKDKNCKVAITGGCDAPLSPLLFAGSCAAKAMSQRNDDPQRACRPFNIDRDGYVMSEGAGILILEEINHALERGAKIYGEIIGYGNTCDAYHITAPIPGGEGLARAVNIAIKEAEVNINEVGYINAHGTSTKLNDQVETEVIKKIFGARAYDIPVNSIKSMTGHLLGAAGAVETISTLLSLQEQWLPPTINYINPDPICDLDYVPNQGKPWQFNIAVKQSVGFGGQNGALVLKKYEG